MADHWEKRAGAEGICFVAMRKQIVFQTKEAKKESHLDWNY